MDCFDPGVPNNGLKQLSSTTFGSTVRYSCRQGYRLEGQAQRTCQASGRWSGTLAQCMPSECGDLGPPQDGRVDFSSTAIGSIASYSCSEGYTLDGTATRICQPNGEWSSLAPDCDCKQNFDMPIIYVSVCNHKCLAVPLCVSACEWECYAVLLHMCNAPLCPTPHAVHFDSFRVYISPSLTLSFSSFTLSCSGGLP